MDCTAEMMFFRILLQFRSTCVSQLHMYSVFQKTTHLKESLAWPYMGVYRTTQKTCILCKLKTCWRKLILPMQGVLSPRQSNALLTFFGRLHAILNTFASQEAKEIENLQKLTWSSKSLTVHSPQCRVNWKYH